MPILVLNWHDTNNMVPRAQHENIFFLMDKAINLKPYVLPRWDMEGQLLMSPCTIYIPLISSLKSYHWPQCLGCQTIQLQYAHSHQSHTSTSIPSTVATMSTFLFWPLHLKTDFYFIPLEKNCSLVISYTNTGPSILMNGLLLYISSSC